VTLAALRGNMIKSNTLDEAKLKPFLNQIVLQIKYNPGSDRYETFMNGENVEDEIRGMKVSENVSLISTIRFIREKLVKFQQEMGKDKGIVMDGRDIGTVVFPQADLKIFMTADQFIRAQRRFKELKEKGTDISMEEIIENIKKRDYVDENRKESPLLKAKDSIVLDNSELTPEEQLKWVMDRIENL